MCRTTCVPRNQLEESSTKTNSALPDNGRSWDETYMQHQTRDYSPKPVFPTLGVGLLEVHSCLLSPAPIQRLDSTPEPVSCQILIVGLCLDGLLPELCDLVGILRAQGRPHTTEQTHDLKRLCRWKPVGERPRNLYSFFGSRRTVDVRKNECF